MVSSVEKTSFQIMSAELDCGPSIVPNTDASHFKTIICAITLLLLVVFFMLVSFIMTVMLLSDFGNLQMLGICVVLLVAPIPIAMHVVCTSTMTLGSRTSYFGREAGHDVTIRIYQETRWSGHVVFGQDSHTRTRHQVQKSMGILLRGIHSRSHELLSSAVLPKKFPWCEKDGTNDCTESRNQQITQYCGSC